jgi:SAM-dependent methyltransferase
VISTGSVLAGYDRRASYSHGETRVTAPRLLPEMLTGARHIAEVPCGAGHFLTEYAAGGLTVTLVDGSRRMLAAARTAALDAGIPAHRLRTRACRVQHLPHLPVLTDVDAWVAPNAALNQLTAQMSLPGTLSALRAAMAPGARLLAQVLCRHEDGTADASSFYDPHEADGAWRTDRQLDPASAGGAASRRRRTRHDGRAVGIDFSYHDTEGTRLHTTTVELYLLEPAELTAGLRAAGFQNVRFQPGGGVRPSEAVAEAHGPGR